MTRDEAIQISYKGTRACESYRAYTDKELLDITALEIDNFVALGILKVEEPESILRRAQVAIQKELDSDFHEGYRWADATEIIVCLDDAGLTIVEK